MRFWPKKNYRKSKTAVKILLLILLLSTAGFLVKNYFSSPSSLKKHEQKIIVIQSPPLEKTLLEQELKSLGIEIENHFLEIGDDLMATLSSGTTLWLKKENDYSKTLASLQLILKNIRIEGKWPLKIDLRFRRPILSY